MSFEIKEMCVKSTDNIHTLSGKIYIPQDNIKGILHIIHGMTEHIDRYDPIMSYAAENGFIAFGYDNLGHGKTAKDESELGFIASNDGWKLLVNDVFAFATAVKNLYPDKPLCLMGHSMGSFIARLAFENFPDLYSKIIICGTGGKNPLAPAGLILTDTIKLIKGKKHGSKMVKKMAFGSYNKRFEGNTGREWLSAETENIMKYTKDKYCTFDFTVSAMHDLIKLNFMSNRKKWYSNIPKDIPILIISGSDDPVGNYGKGVKEVYSKLLKENSGAELKLYDGCRHEILNDSCKPQVFSDVLNFLRK